MLKDSNLPPKIALCLSGQPRSYRTAHDYLRRNLLELYDVDTFVHAWTGNDNAKSRVIWDDIEELYSPKSVFMDTEIPASTNSDMIVPNASHPANFCTSMFYSIYKSNELLNEYSLFNETKYDFVIRSRFDLALNKIINFSTLEKGVLYVSKDIEGPSLLNDQFAIADPSTMNF
jgi:hypothetical protein